MKLAEFFIECYFSITRRISAIICKVYGTVVAICEHVVAEKALAGGDESVGVNESSDVCIVIYLEEVA